jgi:tetratricopeptide (TPR) repeat protein
MSRVTSLTSMPEQQLNRWIKRIALLFVVVLIAFIAFYVFDRFRMPAAPIVDRETAVLEEAVRADPADVVARGQLADVYYAKGRFDDAIEQYTVLIDADKEVYIASLGRAKANQQLAQYDQAITDYEKVVEIGVTGEMANVDPALASAYFGLGTIALIQERYEDAVEQLEKAKAIERTDADVLNALAKALIAIGEVDKAIEHLDLAVALVPIGWAEPYQNLEAAYTKKGEGDLAEWAGAMAAFVTGDHATAETRLLGIAEGDHALEAAVGLGLINEAKGDTAAAASWYQKALAIDPEDTSATLGLGRVRAPAATAAPAGSPAEGIN